MSKKFLIGGIILFAAAMVYSFSFLRPTSVKFSADQAITWYSWSEVQQQMEKEPKKIFVDVYTDWCTWCKKMDKNTFTDPKVAAFMNENFYAVKFNAEQKQDEVYQGQTLSYRPGGRRGVHQLAVVLLNGRLGYPSFAYLDENMNRIHVSPGYKTPEVMLEELQQMVNR
jgi:thioredoxin-related protein